MPVLFSSPEWELNNKITLYNAVVNPEQWIQNKGTLEYAILIFLSAQFRVLKCVSCLMKETMTFSGGEKKEFFKDNQGLNYLP